MEYLYGSDKIKKCLPILQAMAEGGTIQFLIDHKWVDLDSENDGINIETLVNHTEYYRIKPEPIYRPFANTEECWNEMLKHQPFGIIKDKDSLTFRAFIFLDSSGCNFAGYEETPFDEALRNIEFADGKPFGIKEE